MSYDYEPLRYGRTRPAPTGSDRAWFLAGRIAAGFGIALVVVAALAGPAIGYYIDTRVFPGHPLTPAQVAAHVMDQDTMAWVWFIPYMIYGLIGIVVGIAVFCDRVNKARQRLQVDHVFKPLPPKKKALPKESQ